mmetsp:Transcript_55660/g.178600  ORF Transcript_55660/g.178600 Transcript_55660/m.178600 type:complete len:209 (-) Transcript_55660:130-756(-)
MPVCDDFYKKLASTACANIAHSKPWDTEWSAGTWCWVSSECQDLNGGRRLSETPDPWSEKLLGLVSDRSRFKRGSLAWKICMPSTAMVKQDEQLRDLPFDEVLRLSEKLELDRGFAVKHALFNSWLIWPQVEEAWSAGKHEELPEGVQTAISKKTPIIVDSQYGGGGDLMVIIGDEVHTLDYRPSACGPTKYCVIHPKGYRAGRGNEL